MKATWFVLGVVVVGGGIAYGKIRSSADAALARPATGGPGTAGAPSGIEPVPGPGMDDRAAEARPVSAPAAGSADARAAELMKVIADRLKAQDTGGATAAEKALEKEAWDTDAARRYALARGWAALHAAAGKDGAAALGLLDRARRDLSRGVLLPEMFDGAGKPTAERDRVVKAIVETNVRVLTSPLVPPAVARPYVVKAGDTPVDIVTRENLPYGHNAILFWSHGGNLDPGRLRAGEKLMLPVDTLSLRVDLARRRLLVLLGDVFVKEWAVGVGKPESPTFPGTYVVGAKHLNPDWWSPTGLIRFGDPRNELGDAWIPIASAEKPTGYGIHGTNKPETVGSECSNGCVRLANANAKELYWWVRTARGTASATAVVIR
jgi:hypothetical protein